MKRAAHRAFVEELPVGHPDNCEPHAAIVASCFVEHVSGASADTEIETHELLAPGCKGPIERAVFYLGLFCKAEHVL